MLYHDSSQFSRQSSLNQNFAPGAGRQGSPVHPAQYGGYPPGPGAGQTQSYWAASQPMQPQMPQPSMPSQPMQPHMPQPSMPAPQIQPHIMPNLANPTSPRPISPGAIPVPAPVLRPPVPFTDYGPAPFVVNIAQAAINNDYYRQTLWTGPNMQSTLMSIPVGEDIGLEVHPDNDQFLRLESGQGLVQMGDAETNLTLRQTIFDDFAVFVPAGTWHNITNIGTTPLKLYVIYAPPHHPPGTVNPTQADAD